MNFLAGRRSWAILATALACAIGATTAASVATVASAAPAGHRQSFGAAVGAAAGAAVERAAETAPARAGSPAAETVAVAAFPASAQPARPAGQTGTRQEVPWRRVGSGWALAMFTAGSAKVAKPVSLYLVDPAGGKYLMHRWAATTQPWRLLDWSGDKKRALLQQGDGSRPVLHQLVLATGATTTFRLPAAAYLLGYTRPNGHQLLAADHGIVRYSLAGARQKRLVKGGYFSALSSASGRTDLVNSAHGVALISNAGGLIRRLRVPGAVAQYGGCLPVRWWSAAEALVSCPPNSRSASGPRLWLVPVSGKKAATALTPVRHGKGADQGDLDAWRLRSGLYVEALGNCGALSIGKQAADGAVTIVTVPGSSGSNVVVATSGDRLLVHAYGHCLSSSSLDWFNPATGSVITAVPAPANGQGITSVVAYNRNGKEPGSLP